MTKWIIFASVNKAKIINLKQASSQSGRPLALKCAKLRSSLQNEEDEARSREDAVEILSEGRKIQLVHDSLSPKLWKRETGTRLSELLF